MFPGVRAFSRKKTANILGISDTKVGFLIEEGAIVAVNIASTNSRASWRIPASALVAYMEGASNV